MAFYDLNNDEQKKYDESLANIRKILEEWLKNSEKEEPQKTLTYRSNWARKIGYQKSDEKFADILRRVGSIEQEIKQDKNEIQRIEATLSDKLKMNFNILIGLLAAMVLTLFWLVWQSFWMYPDIYKEYSKSTEEQNNKISDLKMQLDVLGNNLLEAKNRIEKEIDRGIILGKTNK